MKTWHKRKLAVGLSTTFAVGATFAIGMHALPRRLEKSPHAHLLLCHVFVKRVVRFSGLNVALIQS